ncbi:MAG: hypothetical protein REI12_15175 [Pedobacter sp.]|nr:hypothetical protein [Pedobacter sp.]
MAEFFNVVFAGEISGRADPAVVRANVGKLFNASDAILDRLFSGQPVAVKKMVDRATAMKLRALLKQAGADARIVQVDEQGKPLQAAAPAAAAPVAPAAPKAPPAPTGTMAARVETLAEQHAREEASKPKPDAPPPPADIAVVSTWALYPVGFLLSAPVARPAPLRPNISGISMSPLGGTIMKPEEIKRPAPVKVDISGMSMAPPGTDVLKESERAKVVPVQVDISGISVAEVGAPLDEIRDNKPPVQVDISHIKLQ